MGSGTVADPFQSITSGVLEWSEVSIVDTDSYVVGDEFYRTDVTLNNPTGSAISAIVYRGGDCFLQESDFGFGSVDPATGSVACVGVSSTSPPTPGTRIERWDPLTPGSSYLHAFYNDFWAAIGSQQPFNNTCRCNEYIDNAAGLSWTVSIPAGGSVTVSHLTTFSPRGGEPPPKLAKAVALEPEYAEVEVGETTTVNATLTVEGTDIPFQYGQVLFEVSGANEASGTDLSDDWGQLSFEYTGSVIGTDTIYACYDRNWSQTCDEDEPSDVAWREWWSEEAEE